MNLGWILEAGSVDTKDSSLGDLREVAPEMELFLENHRQNMKNFVIELNYIQSCYILPFHKKIVS